MLNVSLNWVTVILHEASLESSVSDHSPSNLSDSSSSLLLSSDSSDGTVIISTNGGKRTQAERESAKEVCDTRVNSH